MPSVLCCVCGAGFPAGSTTDALPSESSTGSSQPSLTPSPGTCCLEVIALHYTDTTHVMDSRSRFITYRHFIFHSYQSDRIIPVSVQLGSIRVSISYDDIVLNKVLDVKEVQSSRPQLLFTFLLLACSFSLSLLACYHVCSHQMQI